MLATMRVVVVLPFVPETSTTPSGSCANVRDRNPRVDAFHDFAGERAATADAARRARPRARHCPMATGLRRNSKPYHTASCWDW